MNIITLNPRNITARFLAVLTIVSMIMSAFPVAFFVANATQIPDEETKVDICHWHQNAFESINVSVNSIAGAHGNDTEDIIPAFDDYEGQNLDEMYGDKTGAEILENDCVVSTEPSTGSITIEKIAGDDTTTEFDFTGGLGEFTLVGGSDHTGDDLKPGEYVISESNTEDWELLDITCNDEQMNDSLPSVTIDLEAGDDVTCVFTNRPKQTDPELCTVEAVSDTDTVVVENNAFAVETYDENPAWTASIPGAKWIWELFYVADPTIETTKTFRETFTINGAVSAELDLAADNTYKVWINGDLVSDITDWTNFTNVTQDNYDVLSYLVDGVNTLEIEVTNKTHPYLVTPENNPAGLLYKLVAKGASNCADIDESDPDPEYGPYCGDGEVNQDWEQCDGGESCTEQCQSNEQNSCTDLTLAKINIADVSNVGGEADMTDDLFIGQGALPIPNNVWFKVYEGSTYVNDADLAGYEDISGLAVQRLDGSVRAVMHGSNEASIEHADGDVEFWSWDDSVIANGIVSDDSGNNKLEGEVADTEGTKGNAADDEVWLDGGKANFWLTTTVADDGFYAEYTKPVVCEETDRCENLLDNGSFEVDEVVNVNKWDKFLTVSDWLVEKVSDNSATTLELHNGWSGNEADHGEQYAELDGDEPTRISQTVTTIPGAIYELKWAFAPRQDTAEVENELGVEVDGTQVATTGPSAGIGVLSQGDWTQDDYTFEADGASTKISFLDLGPEAVGDGADVGTFLDDAQLCLVREPEPTATIHTQKIVCTDEADLPNYGAGGPDMTANTASDWVNDPENPSCSLVEGWEFEWGTSDASDPGDTLVGPAIGDDWNTFTGSTEIPASAFTAGYFWMREVLQDDYIPFTHEATPDNSDTVSAEMYCSTDVLNYDNLDRVDNPQADGEYYCVAWNVPVEEPEDPIYGCMDKEALNYNPDATEQGDVACEYDEDEEDPETYRIDGYKYGVYDGYYTLAGWEITADNGEDTLSTTTDENGYYYFDVEEGNWTITEEVQEDWNQVKVTENDWDLFPGEGDAYCSFEVPEEYYYDSRVPQSLDIVIDYSDYRCDFYNEYDGEDIVYGCMDEEAENYNPEATEHDEESCEYENDDEDNDRNSNSGGTRIKKPTPQVLGATTQCPFLIDFMQMGIENNPFEVKKLQLFLNIFVAPTPVTGMFGEVTDANVKKFQEQYRSEVLDPWFEKGIVPHNQPTGFVYKTTLWKINDIICPEYAILPVYEGENLSSNVDLD